jgi:hypothetical protein
MVDSIQMNMDRSISQDSRLSYEIILPFLFQAFH